MLRSHLKATDNVQKNRHISHHEMYRVELGVAAKQGKRSAGRNGSTRPIPVQGALVRAHTSEPGRRVPNASALDVGGCEARCNSSTLLRGLRLQPLPVNTRLASAKKLSIRLARQGAKASGNNVVPGLAEASQDKSLLRWCHVDLGRAVRRVVHTHKCEAECRLCCIGTVSFVALPLGTRWCRSHWSACLPSQPRPGESNCV